MKHYFISVTAYLSVNNMGKELGQYVEDKYNQTVVSEDDFEDVAIDIAEKKTELEKKYPRCRPFRYLTYKGTDRYGQECENIYVKPDSSYNDNVIFSLRTTVIRNEVEVKEGGDS